MCGIVGILGNTAVAERLLSSLQKLEYRGYDSAGIATVHQDAISLRKVTGKIRNLESEVRSNPIEGNLGIGHTRWATHGGVTVKNAHPFIANGIALVHNGIIENYVEIKEFLTHKGFSFESDTDSEVVVKLIEYHHKSGKNEIDSIKATFSEIEGAFAIGVIFASNENLIIGMRKGAPLAIGIGNGEMYLGSDAFALSGYTNKIAYLDDGEFAMLTRSGFTVYSQDGEEVTKTIKTVLLDVNTMDKAPFEHYMLKEIHEQPLISKKVFESYYDAASRSFTFKDKGIDFKKYDRVSIIACGTSFHAASIAKYWLEKYAKLQVEIDYASEFRYRNPIFSKNNLCIVISQSGETADTLAALRHMNEAGLDTIAIVNVEESTIAREAKYVLPLDAGYEIGVASTKVFIAQLMLLSLLSIAASVEKGHLTTNQAEKFIITLREIPKEIHELLYHAEDWNNLATESLSHAKSMIYTGRGASYPVALEGALKIKEVSYIHAEGMAAGELKHGCIALIDENMPVIAIAPSDDLFAKTTSNIQEISARHGKIISLTDDKGAKALRDISSRLIILPETNDFTAPILYTVPLHLLAYYTAVAMNKDVDQPRNLAKSVTVE